MSAVEPLPDLPRGAACAACAVTPAAEVLARHDRRARETRIVLSLPGMTSASCMSRVERKLAAVPGVRLARVNLTLKRASVTAAPDMVPETLIAALDEIGFEAHELDAGALAATETDRAGRDLLMRLGVAGFASMNVMLLSIAVWSGAEGSTRDLMHWVSAAIALPAIAFAAQPFFRNAIAALFRRRQSDMLTG